MMVKELIRLFGILAICATIWFSLQVFELPDIDISTSGNTTATPGITTIPTNDGIHTLSVKGNGTIKTVPDQVSFTISIVESAPTTNEALDLVEQKMQTVMKLLDASHIPQKHIQTKNMTVNEEYSKNNYNERKVAGYKVSHGIQVTVEEKDGQFKKSSIIIGALNQAIKNIKIGSIAFEVNDVHKDRLYQEARQEAFANAKAKADELTRLAGIKLGDVISINEGVRMQPIYRPKTSLQMMDSIAVSNAGTTENTSVSLAPGQVGMSIELILIYELK